MVRCSSAQRARDMITSGDGCPSGAHALPEDEPLQHFAVRWVIQRPGVSCTVVGMQRPEHVDGALSAMRASSEGGTREGGFLE